MRRMILVLLACAPACSVDVEIPTPDPMACFDREQLVSEVREAAEADGLSQDRACCANQQRWVGAERAEWYEATCLELARESEACGADGWEC